ncbi:hypothetical protein MHBO_001356 [Bonamia ostreae]|uniref:Uncharacterized protein n=1 Tax=Bonamia ostreae TaxID=126728 RepID=A0ABV2AJB1_9EUKA
MSAFVVTAILFSSVYALINNCPLHLPNKSTSRMTTYQFNPANITLQTFVLKTKLAPNAYNRVYYRCKEEFTPSKGIIDNGQDGYSMCIGGNYVPYPFCHKKREM